MRGATPPRMSNVGYSPLNKVFTPRNAESYVLAPKYWASPYEKCMHIATSHIPVVHTEQ